MVNWHQFGDEVEQKKHHQSVESLSEFLHIPQDSIADVYEQELILMGQMARVRDYLPILVFRRVRNLLLHR